MCCLHLAMTLHLDAHGAARFGQTLPSSHSGAQEKRKIHTVRLHNGSL